MFTKTSNF